jgi:hypothetical protein
LKLPGVVRVETGLDVNVALSNEAVVTESDISNSDTEECGDTSLGLEPTFPSMAMDTDTLERGIEVAWEFDGYGILRGFIQKSEDDSIYEEGGTFVLKFTNGKRLQMGETKAKEARYERYDMSLEQYLTCHGLNVFIIDPSFYYVRQETFPTGNLEAHIYRNVFEVSILSPTRIYQCREPFAHRRQSHSVNRRR